MQPKAARISPYDHAEDAAPRSARRLFDERFALPIAIDRWERLLTDIAACYADPSLAAELLGWRARRDAEAMCRDAWRWEQWLATNPQGR